MCQGEGESKPLRQAEWAWLGSLPYVEATRLQEEIRDAVGGERAPETLLLLEHDPVITLGRSADSRNILAPASRLEALGIGVIQATRGGDVTFHGPGQLVGYPIFRLRRGVRGHVRAMAKGLIAVLADLGIIAEWRESHPGVWIGREKICAVGVHVRRGIAMHGFALNASIDLAGFQTIVPCGLRGAGVTSIAKLLGHAPALEVLAEKVSQAFAVSFSISMARISAASSRLQIATRDL
jgi:lipoyl(octanoyl) transferase